MKVAKLHHKVNLENPTMP